ncbi:C2H2 type zinc finger domain-containing protein [Hirsutella rhossiliensis]|uniref:C2H2 type zinc finger domain-containing protein n=1 Tax=Hirsutella rhossiliensis TaxID=111463 RepID=A0A9P8MST6_9HYPO|nr:C2H2 type zinc finger domain-containing protein [Hirsutella rhossiliensis]KAH0960519.1 C2H2 type zinc finger domain-containing protein [Hirsutella rhossiliensis]
MTTAARQQQQPQTLLAADTFDPDEVVPRDSPLMQALRPKLEPSPSPSPDIPLAQVSLSPPPTDGFINSNRSKIRPSSGDAVLVSYLDNGRHPDIARAAGAQALPGVDEDDQGQLHHPRPSSSNMAMTTPILQHLAADALQAVSAESSLIPLLREVPDISTSTRQLSISDERHKNISDYSASMQPSGPSVQLKTSAKSPASTLNSASGELPPLQMDSPQSESNGHSLPSIRSTLGDIKHMPAEKEMAPIHGSAPAFARSPPLASSPYSYYQTNGLGHRPSVELSTSAAGETPSTDHSASTPATSASVADRMSIDGITNPQVGVYICNFSGCNAPPFQTQYLLNSHANVHSSARPHYCPVKGCPRSEGGKGFKRKNEMIRHGLVHDSPGYVCPFCPDREHKYPRPDNLQRHVRVHHIDKDKDDPMLRDVLSQRPDGPSRGRRRRGVPP